MFRKSLITAILVIGGFVLLSAISRQFATIAPYFGVIVMTLVLRDFFLGTSKYVPEDRIYQGKDPLNQYFNKYDGV